MKVGIILVNGYSFCLEDIIIVKELISTKIKLYSDNYEKNKQFYIYLHGGFVLHMSQNIKEDTQDNTIDLLYNAIYNRTTRITVNHEVIDVSSLDTSTIFVELKRL